MQPAGPRFDRIYEDHHRDILAYCLRRTNRDDAYAAANEVFEVAWKRADAVPDGDQALPWLYGVARKVIARQRRTSGRFTSLRSRLAQFGTPPVDGPEAVVVRRSEYEAVCRAVSRLDDVDREMLLLSAWEGLSHAEIAAGMGYSLAAVDKRLSRAKKRLKRQFDAIESTNLHRPPASTAKGGDGT